MKSKCEIRRMRARGGRGLVSGMPETQKYEVFSPKKYDVNEPVLVPVSSARERESKRAYEKKQLNGTLNRTLVW